VAVREGKLKLRGRLILLLADRFHDIPLDNNYDGYTHTIPYGFITQYSDFLRRKIWSPVVKNQFDSPFTNDNV